MKSVAPTPIDKLQPYVKAAKIKVRICRIWKSTIPKTVQKYTALHCILLDEMIEACITKMDNEIVASKIEAGSCYEIMGFRTNRMRGQYRVVPHDTQVVFTRKTIFKKLSNVFPPIPQYRFFLQDYNPLYPLLNTVDILIDVIGHVIGVRELEPKHYLRQQLLFSQNVLSNTALLLFFLDPDIPELNAVSNNTEVVKLLTPSLRQDETFLCRASIKRFDTRYDWWYSAYPNYVKQMQKDPASGQLVCQKHSTQIPTPW
ncbi:unnamed protein product [Malus baccata var. baccata]